MQRNGRLPYICGMVRPTLLLLFFALGLFLYSCTSEYEERLSQGLSLRERLAMIEQTQALAENPRLEEEIAEIRNEINLLAKVSGNEELFLQQVFGSHNSNSLFGSQK